MKNYHILVLKHKTNTIYLENQDIHIQVHVDFREEFWMYLKVE